MTIFIYYKNGVINTWNVYLNIIQEILEVIHKYINHTLKNARLFRSVFEINIKWLIRIDFEIHNIRLQLRIGLLELKSHFSLAQTFVRKLDGELSLDSLLHKF